MCAALKDMVLSGTKDNVREVVKELLQRLKAATDWLVSTGYLQNADNF